MGRRNRQPERRAEILAAAKRVTVRDGASGATLRAIATESGMEPPGVLYYFSDLAEIIRETVFASSDAFIERIETEVASAHTPLAKLNAAIRAGTTGGIDSDDSLVLYEFWPAGLRDPALGDADHALADREAAILSRIIDEGVREGVFAPALEVNDVALTIVALEDGLVMDILAGTKSSQQVVALIEIVAQTLVGVAARSRLG